jgi:hypothetical protein
MSDFSLRRRFGRRARSIRASQSHILPFRLTVLFACLWATLCASRAQAQTDTTSPIITLAAPVSNAVITALPAISGTVRDRGTSGGAATGVARVDVWLMRSHSTIRESWNGTAWGTQEVALAVALGSNGGNTSNDVSWQVSAPLPTGSLLVAGKYLVKFIAKDLRGNETQSASSSFSIGPFDNTSPGVTINSPVSEAVFDQLPLTLTGTVTDVGSGVGRMDMKLTRSWSERLEYWNGTTWTSNAFTTPVTISAPDANGVSQWTYTLPSPPTGENVPSTRYAFGLTADDRYGNRGSATCYVRIVPNDTTRPVVAITYPLSGQSVSRLPQIQGTASDEENGSGLYSVSVQLARTVTVNGSSQAQSWKAVAGGGGSWVAGAAYLPSSTEFSWTRATDLPVGANLPVGAYRVVAFCQDRYNNVSTIVTHHFNIVAALPLDALLAPGYSATPALPESAFVGLGITNLNATQQSVTRVVDAGTAGEFTVSIRKGAGSDDVAVTAPVLTDGWGARYFFGEQEITTLVHGAGWVRAFGPGAEVRLRVEVTPPITAAQGEVQSILIRAQGATSDGSGYDTDVVKAIVSANIITQPDLSVRLIKDDSTPDWVGETPGGETLLPAEAPWTGETLLGSDGANQILSGVTMFGFTRTYALRIKNTGSVAKPFNLVLPAQPNGWTLQLFDTLAGENEITVPVSGWTTPIIAAGESLEVRLDITASTEASGPYSALVRANSGALVDAVKIITAFQKIDKIQWSNDGIDWHNFDGTLITSQPRTVGFRAVPDDPSLDWEGYLIYKPTWRLVNLAGLAQEEIYVGKQLWIKFPLVGTWTLTADGNNQKTATIEVQDDTE